MNLYNDLLKELIPGIWHGIVLSYKILKKKIRNETSFINFLFHGDHRTPDPTSMNNVFRWYTLQRMAVVAGTNEQISKDWTIFLTFDLPINPRRLLVTSSQPIPPYEVKDFSSRSAIIIIMGEINGSLNILIEE